MITTKQQDLIAAMLFIVVALLVLFVAIPLGVQEPKKVKFAALNPSYYPRIVCYCLLIFGVALFVTRFFSKSVVNSETQSTTNGFKFLSLVWIICLLAFYYFSLPMFGFVLSSMIALLVLLLLAGESSKVALICLPIALPFGLYFFFVKVANIPIPAGVLEALLVGS